MEIKKDQLIVINDILQNAVKDLNGISDGSICYTQGDRELETISYNLEYIAELLGLKLEDTDVEE